MDENDDISAYWWHYFIDNRVAALYDFNVRDEDGSDEATGDQEE